MDSKVDQKYKDDYVKANMPEVVKDFSGDCKWQYYMPSGGYDFQKDFTEFWIPHFDAQITKLNDERANAGIAAAKYAEIMREMADARNALIEARLYFEKNPDVKQKALLATGIAGEFFASDFEWLQTAPEKVHGMWTAMSSLGGLDSNGGADNAANITFLTALRDFFRIDREFDILMWLLTEVDAKYRAKVSRACYRLAKDQMIRLSLIENCNTELSFKYKEIFSYPLNVLGHGTRMSYDSLKEAKKHGLGIFQCSDNQLRRTLHEQQQEAAWDLVRPDED